jgi:hypothetical protein
MEAIHDEASLVDAAAFGPETRAITATVPRLEIENVLGEGGQPELVLELARRNGGDQTHTLEIDWAATDLEELLQRTSGDYVTLVFNEEELERAFDADFEAHGVREAAATFAVMAAVAAGSAAQASASPVGDLAYGGAGSSGTPIQMVSDAATSGPVQAATAPEQVSDAASTGPVVAETAQTPELISDNAMTGPVAVEAAPSSELISDNAMTGPVAVEAAQSSELISDNAMTGPVAVEAAQSSELISDNAMTGPVAVQASGTEMISDAASSGPVTVTPEESSDGGFSISAPDPSTTGAIVGGTALLIAAAGFAIRGQRKQAGHPA